MEDELLDDPFDLPFHKPFQEENESDDHCKHRCDRSTAGLKQDMERMCGSGGVYRNYYKREAYAKSSKAPHRPQNGMR